jgi:hypothetical protein
VRLNRVDQLERHRWQPSGMARLMRLVMERGWRWAINLDAPGLPCLVSRSGKVFDVRVTPGGVAVRRHFSEFQLN